MKLNFCNGKEFGEYDDEEVGLEKNRGWKFSNDSKLMERIKKKTFFSSNEIFNIYFYNFFFILMENIFLSEWCIYPWALFCTGEVNVFSFG